MRLANHAPETVLPPPLDAKLVRAATAELRGLRVPYHDGRFPLDPTILPGHTWDALASAGQTVIEGIDALMAGQFGGDPQRMAAAVGARPRETALWDSFPRHDWALLARPDIVPAGGRLAVVELNATCLAGLVTVSDQLARAQARLPGVQARLTALGARPARTTAALAALLRAEAGGARGGLVAIAYWDDEEPLEGPEYYYGSLARELSRCGLPACACPIEALDLAGERVTLDGEPVACMYRFFSPPKPYEHDKVAAIGRILDLAAAGRLGLFAGFRSELTISKAWLALLSDERCTERLPGGLADRLARVVPWTRLLEERHTVHRAERIDLVPWILRHQDRLVVKPARGHSGRGVTFGCEVDGRGWHESVAVGLRDHDPWLVQELVVPDRAMLTVIGEDGSPTSRHVPAIYSVFLLGRRMAGAVRRYSGGPGASLKVSAPGGAVVGPVHWLPRDQVVNGR